MNILEEIAAYAKFRVDVDKNKIPLDEIKLLAKNSKVGDGKKFLATLKRDDLSFICEVKKASPSKGIIAENFPYVEIAKEYEVAGADCISCLTEPKYFLGSDEIFQQIRAEVSIPMLRKDFTVDEYQIYQAKVMGADAVLLICAILDATTIERYLKICADLNLAALVETHNENEIEMALKAGAEIIGVNNRNLKNFTVDFSNAARLRELIPPNKIYVAESGVKNSADVATLKKIGADAVLIGETLMRAIDKKFALESLKMSKF
ncbi:MAG: indole-3-glycerol phosphate synthase TrpC [Selenomonadaceae bacterium]|nr:indole-3-glycerol phosphate synthase TrpC [Selenomonadaceae bacterium]